MILGASVKPISYLKARTSRLIRNLSEHRGGSLTVNKYQRVYYVPLSTLHSITSCPGMKLRCVVQARLAQLHTGGQRDLETEIYQ